MHIAETVADLRKIRGSFGGRVGVVLTMGYLHAGHLALVEAARKENDAVIATIFVNPTQFAAGEDLSAYPRDLPRDLDMLRAAGVDAVFTPPVTEMYPPRFQTYVTVEQVTQGKEGGVRPGHFRGVATVVARLFNLTQPTSTYFGQKDAQQVVVIRQMVRDLAFPLNVVVVPTMREPDGLAMSSRNVYLTPDERSRATVLYRALRAAGDAYERGERHPERLSQVALDMLATEPLAHVDYVSIADAHTLEDASAPVETPLLISLAAKLGKPRLLDNCLFPLSLNTRDGLTASLGAY